MSIKIQANPSASGSTPTGGLTYKGSYDAALQTPNLDSSLKGDFYIVSDAGSLDGVALNVGDHIVFNQDASSPITSAMFDVIDNTDAVASVNGETGVVVLNLKTINDVNATLTPSDSTFLVGDGSEWIGESGATARTSLGLSIGSDVQAHDAQLDDVAGLTPADGAFIVGDGSNFVTETLGTARNSLGLGTVATLDVGNGANQVVQMTAAAKLPAVDGSLLTNLPSGGDLLASNNLSDLDNAGTARTNLGLAIGTNVQAFDAQLTDVAGLTPTDGNIIIGDGSNFVTESGATARTSLGLSIGSDVQAFDAQLTDVAGLTPTDGNIIIGDGSNFITESGATARTSLGLSIGSDVQAFDAQLTDIAGLTPTDSNFIVGDGSNFILESGLTARTSLGCGSAATFDAGANSANQLVQLTAAAKLPAVDGSLLTNLPGGGDLLAANNLSDLDNAGTARTNLGLAIGSDVQAFDAQLTDVAGLTPTDGNIIIGDGSNFVTESGATARTSLGLSIGSDVQAFDAQLTDIAGLTPTDSNFIVGDGSNFILESGLTARTSLGCGSAATFDAGANSANQLVQLTAAAKLPAVDGSLLTNLPGGGDLLAANNLSDLDNAGTARTNLGLAIGSDVQAFDAQLTDVAGLTPTDSNFIVGDGSNFITESGATARTSLGLAIGSDVQAFDAQLTDVAGLTPADGAFIVGDGSNFVTETLGTARNSLGLGTVATLDVGNGANQIVQMTAAAKLPAVDGSLLTNLPSGGASTPDTTTVSQGTDYTISTSTGIEEAFFITPTADINVNLPSAVTVGEGYKYNIKNLASGFSLTVDADGTQTIDASLTYVINNQFQSITIMSDGANWFII